MLVGVICWIVLGLVVGCGVSALGNRRREGVPTDIVLGIAGAVTGGWLFRGSGSPGVAGFNVWTLIPAMVGVMAVLLIRHGIRRSPWRA